MGRHSESETLSDALDAARKGAGGTVLLVGEPGIGKSRLVGECVDQARMAGVRILRGHGGPDGRTAPFQPLVEAVSCQFRSGLPQGVPELGPYLATLARVIPDLRVEREARLPVSIAETAEALLRLLAVLGGAEQGALVALEDLHDADRETLAVLDYLANHLADVPVLLTATVRPEPGPALDLVRDVDRRRAGTVLELDRLPAEEVRVLAARCLRIDPGEVPTSLAQQLEEHGAGNPFLVEELLADMVDSGWLRATARGWQPGGDPYAAVPRSVVAAHDRRMARLDPGVRELLRVAAVLGHQFTAAVLRVVTSSDESVLFDRLRTAIEAGFILPDPAAPDGYRFRHALTAEAVLAALLPGEQAAIAQRAAAAIEADDPALPGERCLLVASLCQTAGDGGAARYWGEAGRRALVLGAGESAVALLELAYECAGSVPARAPEIAALLIEALIEADHLDRALVLLSSPADVAGIEVGRRKALHSRFAWVAAMAGRRAQAAAQLAEAAKLSGAEAGAEAGAGAEVLLAQAYVVFMQGDGGPDERRVQAERLASLAAAEAEAGQTPSPVLACQALQLLALLARDQGFSAADSTLRRMLDAAERNDLPLWRIQALLGIAVNDFMSTGARAPLETARDTAFRLGSISTGYVAENVLALQAVLTGDHARAEETLKRCRATTIQVHGLGDERYPILTAATLAAHQGRRAAMEQALAAFPEPDTSPLMPLKLGLCRAICALLEEDRPQALREMTALASWNAANPSPFFLAGQHGLDPLLKALEKQVSWAGYKRIAAGPGAMLKWNAQFLHLTRAVLLGRKGLPAEAVSAVDAAREAAVAFPMARALGLRLVAEAAIADRWGDPEQWLRTAEEYFHAHDVQPVAGMCRALLRRSGARVTQRREGSERIPAVLRDRGVTVREYQVFALLPDRPSNKAIARQLVISPRTVEKYMASLIAKVGLADRASLCAFAAELVNRDGC